MSRRAYIPTPLPHEPSFVGRRHYLQTIADLFDSGVRVVSIAGPGGIGKTTLSARFGSETRAFDSVVFVALADVETADGLAAATASTLRVELEAAEDPLDRVGNALAGLEKPLVILDNVEQMLEITTHAVSRWLRQAPELCFVVTTRTPLHIRDERTIDLGPLDVDDAEKLFDHHARVDTDPVARRQLVEALDRLPLAIVLAASMAHMMPPGQMLDQFDKSLEILRSRDPMIEERHSSLLKAIEWSWDLITQAQRELLHGLTIFRGGFSIDDVVAVLRPKDPFVEVLEDISDLLDASMLTRTGATAPARFEMMNSIRLYVQRRITEHEPKIIERHARHFVRRARDRISKLHSHERARSVQDLRQDLDNLFLAWHRSRGTLRGDAAVCIAYALAELGVAERLGHFFDEVRDTRLTDEQRAELLTIESRIRYERLELERADEAITEGLELAQKLENRVFGTHLEISRTKLLLRRQKYEEAWKAARRACDAAGETEDLVARVEAQRWLAKVHQERGELEIARERLERTLTQAESADVPPLIANLLANLAEVDRDTGKHSSEERRLLQAKTVYQSLNSRKMIAGCDYRLGCLLRRQHRLDEAQPHLENAAELAKLLAIRDGLPFALVELGTLYHQLEKFDRAEDLLEEALRHTPDDIVSFATGALGVLHLEKGRFATAREHLRAQLARGNEIGQHRFDGVARTSLALTAWFEKSLVEARAFVDAAIDAATDGAGQRHIPMTWALRGALYANDGELAAAEAAFDEAAELASVDDFRDIPSAVLVLEGFIDMARGNLDDARARVKAAEVDWRSRSIETRICARLLATSLDRLSDAGRSSGPLLRVHERGDYFEWGGDEVDISRRRAHRRILAALAASAASGADRAFDVYELFEIGWPDDEGTAPDVGARRVYTTIRELRDMGLEDVLATGDEGYLLDGVRVEIV